MGTGNSRRLKIAYLCDFDPRDPTLYSGGNARMLAALETHAGDVTVLPQDWGLAEPLRRAVLAAPEAVSIRARWRLHLMLSWLVAGRVARALAQDAQLYLMDEPFAGVDAATEHAIVDVMRDVRDDGATVICVHHDLQTVADYFDHALIMNVRPVAAGTIGNVLSEEHLQRAYGGRLAETEIRAIARAG